MNAHLAQSEEATVELEEIAAVPHHIITPRHAKPMIGVYQDTLVGSYRLTQPGIEFTRREFMNLMMWNKRFDGTMPTARAGTQEQKRWTGQQVLSALLPPINIEMSNKSFDKDKGESQDSHNYVKIVQGDIKQGVVDGDIYMKPSNGIIHVTYNDHGAKDTVGLLDALQNTVENFLVLNGFSVGISDLIADEETKRQIQEKIQERKKQVEQVILQVHLDLFDNNTGKTNQQEFEDQIFGILNKATSDAGSTGQQSLSTENRLLAMVRSGSKGEPLNVAQMMACLGQTAIEGKRVPYGFTDRTLPHYKKYDDSAESRGFIESSFIRGLTPQQFFFHAMSGREGLIDTAVKSVTGDTEVVIQENGETKWTTIGAWIDAHLAAHSEEVEHHETANMELLNLTHEVYVPNTDMNGTMTWGKMTAITRHDPGDVLYQITTQAGKEVIVTAGKSLLIWDSERQMLKQVYTREVKVGDCVPVTMMLPAAPHTPTHLAMSTFFPKTEYVYGTDFHVAKEAMVAAQADKFHIPRGWWEKSNGTLFTLPYPSKARFQRVLSGRSKVEQIQPGFFYAYHAERTEVQLPEQFELNEENGIFIGLFLADGNADIPSGYVQITKNEESVCTFVKKWYTKMGMKFQETSRTMTLPTAKASTGTSTEIRGFSRLLAQFLTAWVGHGSEHKHVPDVALTAPLEFVKGLLNGYISGDGYVSRNGIVMSSASKRMMDGMAMLFSRLGVFAYQSTSQQKSNNLGTEHILPCYILTIRSHWANKVQTSLSLIHAEKQEKLRAMTTSVSHLRYDHHQDIVLDTITKIQEVSTEHYPKMYDVTVPSTLNFSIANGLGIVDTADTGYIQRQLIKSMEDLTVQHDGTVRDANQNIIQYHYGEDGINATKIETQSFPIGKLSQEDIQTQFGLKNIDWSTILEDGVVRENEDAALTEFTEQVKKDQFMMVEEVFQKKSLDSGSVFAPVNLQRWILNIKNRFHLKPDQKTNLTPLMVLQGIQALIQRTHSYHKIWCALLRFHLAPHKLIVKERFTKDAFEVLMELIVVSHMKAWVQPGDQVGIVAAQSIGEPSTQMSCLKSTTICITDGADTRFYGCIGDFIDALLEKNKADVRTLSKNSVVLPMKEDYYIIGVSTDEKTSWKRISEVSRHPAKGGIIEVVTRTGRRTTATLSHSFLKRSPTGIVPVLGSELQIGMRIPIAKVIPEVPGALHEITQGATTFHLNKEFGWVCGMYLADGCVNGNTIRITKISSVVEQTLIQFAEQYDMKFSVNQYQGAFGPGKDNNLHSKDLKDFLMATFKTGSYEKQIDGIVFHCNTAFIAGLIGGFFDGDGNISVERQLIRASSRSKKLIEQITALLGYVGMYATMSEETSVRIENKVQYTMCIPYKFAAKYEKEIGFQLEEKKKALQELIARGPQKKNGIDKIPELGAILAETGKLLKMPGQSRNYGRWAKKESIGRETLEAYLPQFEAKFEEYEANGDKWEGRATVEAHLAVLRSAVDADVLWDEIVELIEYDDPKEYVYDFTVPGNDSFMVDCNVLVHNTLNTFHQAGVASKSAVTRGVPRLRELLKVTQNPKATSLTIYLKPEYRNNKEKAREVVQDLELTVLRNITDKVAIYWDEKDESTVVEEDKKLMEFYHLFEAGLIQDGQVEESALSKWMLRLELNREEMFNRNISIQEVVSVIKTQFSNDEIHVVYSDYNSDKLVMRIRIPNKEAAKDTASQMDEFTNLKKFQNKLLNSIVIRGFPGIKAVTFRNDKQYVEQVDGTYQPVEQFVLDTDGSNFLKVMNHPAVDGTKLYSTNVWDVYEVLGVEATRAILFNEISGLFESVGVNYRHLCLLCDVMTRFGRLMSIDRYGINKNDIGTLAKASFEETGKILLKAALFGEVDPVTGVSANIMMGQAIRGGTAFSQILLDDQMIPELLKDIDTKKHALEEEEEGDLTQLDDTGASMVDACSSAHFQMNMVLPPSTEVVQEPEIELDIIE